MKREPNSALTLKGVLLYVLAYLLWLVSIAACVAAVIQLRSTVNVLWVRLGGDPHTLGLANQVCLLLGGLAALIYVMYLEVYYRESVRISKSLNRPGLDLLLRRFGVTMALPLGVVALSLAALEIALRTLH